MIKILTDRFIELIYTERYTDEQLKKYLELILSKDVDLEEARKILLGAAK